MSDENNTKSQQVKPEQIFPSVVNTAIPSPSAKWGKGEKNPVAAIANLAQGKSRVLNNGVYAVQLDNAQEKGVFLGLKPLAKRTVEVDQASESVAVKEVMPSSAAPMEVSAYDWLSISQINEKVSSDDSQLMTEVNYFSDSPSKNMVHSLCSGSPYVFTRYNGGLVPGWRTSAKIRSVNGVPIQAFPFVIQPDRYFEIVLDNGQTHLIASSMEASLNIINSQAGFTYFALQAGFYGDFVSWALVEDKNLGISNDINILKTFALAKPASVTVDTEVKNDKVLVSYKFTMDEKAPSKQHPIMMLQPHLYRTFSQKTAIITGMVSKPLFSLETAIVGKYDEVDSPTITFEVPKVGVDTKFPVISNYHKTLLFNIARQAAEASMPSMDSDIGDISKFLSAKVKAAYLGELIRDKADFSYIVSGLSTFLKSFFTQQDPKSNAFAYDSTWGGIITRRSASNPNVDSGVSQYNAHFAAYHGFVEAAAFLAKYDKSFLTFPIGNGTVVDAINCIINDCSKYHQPFLGHFIDGNKDVGYGQQHKLAADAMKFQQAAVIWAREANQTELLDKMQAQLALEVYNERCYRQVNAVCGADVYPHKMQDALDSHDQPFVSLQEMSRVSSSISNSSLFSVENDINIPPQISASAIPYDWALGNLPKSSFSLLMNMSDSNPQLPLVARAAAYSANSTQMGSIFNKIINLAPTYISFTDVAVLLNDILLINSTRHIYQPVPQNSTKPEPSVVPHPSQKSAAAQHKGFLYNAVNGFANMANIGLGLLVSSVSSAIDWAKSGIEIEPEHASLSEKQYVEYNKAAFERPVSFIQPVQNLVSTLNAGLVLSLAMSSSGNTKEDIKQEEIKEAYQLMVDENGKPLNKYFAAYLKAFGESEDAFVTYSLMPDEVEDRLASLASGEQAALAELDGKSTKELMQLLEINRTRVEKVLPIIKPVVGVLADRQQQTQPVISVAKTGLFQQQKPVLVLDVEQNQHSMLGAAQAVPAAIAPTNK